MNSALSRNDTLYFTVATAGHVDHGKTSLLRALTGTDPDRLKEEKQRGLTTDLGFAHLTLKSENSEGVVKIGFVDVPGHGKFLKNMLAGVGGIDLALLVVAADEGPMPQTDQHAKILSLLGVRNVILILTKIDIASEEQKLSAEARALALLKTNQLNCASVVQVSSTTRDGIDKIAPALLSFLRKGIDRSELVEEPVYLPIDRVFTKAGYGTVITGTLVRGTLTTGDNVHIEPGALTARIRGMESFGKSVERAQAGQRLAVNLVLKQSKPLARGQAVFNAPPTECKNLIARFNLFDGDSSAELLKSLPGQQLRVYHGTAEVAGHLRWLEEVQTGSGPVLVGQISLLAPLIAEPGERFVARYEDTGVTGGEIIIGVRARWLSRKKLMPLVSLLLASDYAGAISNFIESSPQHLINEDAVLGILPIPQRVLLSALMLEGKLVSIGEFVSTEAAKSAMSNRLLNLLSQLESEGAEQSTTKATGGVSLELLRARALAHADRSVFQYLVKSLLESGQVFKDGDKLSTKNPRAQDSSTMESTAEEDSVTLEIVQRQLCLELKEVARTQEISPSDLMQIINRLVKKGLVVIVARDFVSSVDEINRAHQVLFDIWQQKRDISPSEFKERLGVSRKYAMALLEYFDDHSVTKRVNNTRTLLKRPRA